MWSWIESLWKIHSKVFDQFNSYNIRLPNPPCCSFLHKPSLSIGKNYSNDWFCLTIFFPLKCTITNSKDFASEIKDYLYPTNSIVLCNISNMYTYSNYTSQGGYYLLGLKPALERTTKSLISHRGCKIVWVIIEHCTMNHQTRKLIMSFKTL